jgi:glycosyltransferase involved in cell wall biosynthesis
MNDRRVISVVIPARNEGERVADTIRSAMETRTSGCGLEFVVVDDASDEGCGVRFGPDLDGADIRVVRLAERAGVAGARNRGARAASGDILFITDAHVGFSSGWDDEVLRRIGDVRMLAATICDTVSAFRGYGCSLLVPFMGTAWNREPIAGEPPFVQIASSAGTVLTKELFEKIGGYDEGMRLYGGIEPEFSVRAWLSGAEIVSVPSLRMLHRFKTKPEVERFVGELKPHLVHNNLRFGLLYLGESVSLQMIRHFAMMYPDEIGEAVRQVEASDIGERRKVLGTRLRHDFAWFVRRFGVKDQTGAEVWI